ncbi:MAG TPA: lamin tail domain-containing protein, partial [Dongiaceae bacterium]|nr:lamin tail domain-containing protein [Dongiaceae bacterium]
MRSDPTYSAPRRKATPGASSISSFRFPTLPYTMLPCALALSLLAPAAQAELIFSEYIEGSSNNKALEIYNNGATAVNLSGYNIFMSFNGGSTVATINLTGTV